MRAYGRFIKNIAALLLLLALLSLLLPFCRFRAAGQDMTLSGLEVLTVGGKAGYTYLQQGGVPEDYVLKEPFTWGDVREGLQYADQTGHSDLLILAGAAAGIPVLLCFLSMCLLFLAEGKKSMVLPTLFMVVVAAELMVILVGVPLLQPFLLAGVRIFAALNILALVFVAAGWLLGGYRRPRNDRRSSSDQSRDREDEEKGRGASERRRHGRRKRSKRRGKSRSSKDKKKKGKEKDDRKDSSEKEKQKENTQKTKAATGRISGGTGMYAGVSGNLSAAGSMTVGTTPEAVRGLEKGSLQAAGRIADHNCQITFDPRSGAYTIESHAAEYIRLRQGGRVIRQLKNGERVRISGQIQLEVENGHSLWLR